MNKFFAIFSILNFVAFSYGKVAEYKKENDIELVSGIGAEEIATANVENIWNEDDFEAVKEFDDDEVEGIDKNNKDEELQENAYPAGYFTTFATGNDCREKCTIKFSNLGPLLFDKFTNCYLYDGTAGVRDGYRFLGNGEYQIITDINVRLKCIVYGHEYGTVARGRIYTDDNTTNRIKSNDGMLTGNIASGTELEFGYYNEVYIGGKKFFVALSTCGDVWSRPSKSCQYTILDMSDIGDCGYLKYYTGDIYHFCKNTCCGKNNQCGSSDEYCGSGCQSKYGNCKPHSSGGSSSGSIKTTTDGRCGSYNGKNCHTNYCCSKYGYCGKTEDYCSPKKGCQGKYGYCW